MSPAIVLRVAKMAFSGEPPSLLRLDEEEDAGVREGGEFQRRFHQRRVDHLVHVVQLSHQTQQTLRSRHQPWDEGKTKLD